MKIQIYNHQTAPKTYEKKVTTQTNVHRQSRCRQNAQPNWYSYRFLVYLFLWYYNSKHHKRSAIRTTTDTLRKKIISMLGKKKATIAYKVKRKKGILSPRLTCWVGIKVQTQVHCTFSSCLDTFICNPNTSVWTAVFGLMHCVLLTFY